MKTLTFNEKEVNILVEGLEVQIETLVDLYTLEELIIEDEWENLKVQVSLLKQLGGKFETKLLQQSLKIVENN